MAVPNILIYDHETRGNHEPEQQLPNLPLSTLSKICICILPVVVILYAFFSRAPLIVLIAGIVSLAPAALCAVIIKRLGDTSLPTSFLIEQICWGAVPGFLGAGLVELALVVLVSLTFLRHDLERAGELMKQADFNKAIFSLARQLGVWKIIVISLFAAYIVAGGVEESAKLLIGFRSKKLMPGGSRNVNISPHGVVASVMAGALGLAAAEHFLFTMQATQALLVFSGLHVQSVGVLVLLGMSIGRAVLAFPIHLGTALFIGVAMARKLVLKENVKILWAFLLAVFVHGTFDALSFFVEGLVTLKILPAKLWVAVMLYAVDIGITVTLMFICRKMYKSLELSGGYATLEGYDAV